MAEKFVKISEGLLEETLASAFAPVVTISELIKNSSDACIKLKDTIRIEVNTAEHTIVIKDNGSGFSANDFENLSNVGMSQKMADGNLTSQIGEPYAGSKGLGILTAFNICNRLELRTYSIEDKCAYQMSWNKGTQKIVYYKIDSDIVGTELNLIGVSDEDMKLIMRGDELTKLYSSSITYYTDSETLPAIEIYENGIKKHRGQKIKIEAIYQKYREYKGERKGFFIAKGAFSYSNNKLILAYDDNYKNLFNFSNEEIDLTDPDSIDSFLFRHNIDFKSVISRSVSEMCNNYDSQTFLDDFSGVYYIWREKKETDITYPCGVRIYVNNYGLYNYLTTENDWLLHSEISQNISASNYKLKNTYGYIRFDSFNESRSGLKISKERNDFVVNLAKIKFLYIMQGFVSGIFSSIDITLKDKKFKRYIFKLRCDTRKLLYGDEFNIKELLYTTIPLENVIIEHDEAVNINRENGHVTVNQIGKHIIKFSDGSEWLDVIVNVEDSTPFFELSQTSIKKLQGETIELRNFINKGTLVNIRLDDIRIQSDSARIKNDTFSQQNYPGDYAIQYIYKIDENIHICRILKIKVEQLYINDSNKFQKIFPFYKGLNDFIKIKEIIGEISKCYTQYPNISIIALRSLLEVSIRAFLIGICEDEKGSQKKIPIDQAIGWSLDEIYKKNQKLDPIVLGKYGDRLTKDRKKLIKDYNNLEFNSYVHECDTLPTSQEVLQAAKRFSLFLNFIIESLVAKQDLYSPSSISDA